MYYLNQSQNPLKRANRAALPITPQTVTIFISPNIGLGQHINIYSSTSYM